MSNIMTLTFHKELRIFDVAVVKGILADSALISSPESVVIGGSMVAPPVWRSPRGTYRHFFQDAQHNYGYVLDLGKGTFSAFGPLSSHNFKSLKEAKNYIESTYRRN